MLCTVTQLFSGEEHSVVLPQHSQPELLGCGEGAVDPDALHSGGESPL